MDEANRLVIQHLDTLRVPAYIICQVREELVQRTDWPKEPKYAALQESPRESVLMRLVPPNNSRASPDYETVPKIDTSAITGGGCTGGVQFTPSSGSTSVVDSSSGNSARDMVWHKICRRARKYCGTPESESNDHGRGVQALIEAKGYGAALDRDFGDDAEDTSDSALDAGAQDQDNYQRQVGEPSTISQRSRKAKTKYKSITPYYELFSRRSHGTKGYVTLAEASPIGWRWSPLYEQDASTSPRGVQYENTVWNPRLCWRAMQKVLLGFWECCIQPLTAPRRNMQLTHSESREAVEDWAEKPARETKRSKKYQDLGSIRTQMALNTVPHFSLDSARRPSSQEAATQHFSMDAASNHSSACADGESDNEGVASDIGDTGSNRYEQLSTAQGRPVPRASGSSQAARQDRSRRPPHMPSPPVHLATDATSSSVGVSSFTSTSSKGDRTFDWEAGSGLSGMSRAPSLDVLLSNEGNQMVRPPSQEFGEAVFSAMSGAPFSLPERSASRASLQQASSASAFSATPLPPPLQLARPMEQDVMSSTKNLAPPPDRPAPVHRVEAADEGAGAPCSKATPTLFTSGMKPKVASAPSMSPRDGEFRIADADEDEDDDAGGRCRPSADVEPWKFPEEVGNVRTRIQGWETGSPVRVNDRHASTTDSTSL